MGANLLFLSLSYSLSDLDPVSVVSVNPVMINKGDPLELQCKTKSSDDYIISWMKASHKSLLSSLSSIFMMIIIMNLGMITNC